MQRRVFLGAVSGSLAAYILNTGSRNPQRSVDEKSWEPHRSDLEMQITHLMRATRVPGLSLAVFKRAKLVWRRGFGVKDTVSGDPVDTSTLFEAASMSKPVFAY